MSFVVAFEVIFAGVDAAEFATIWDTRDGDFYCYWRKTSFAVICRYRIMDAFEIACVTDFVVFGRLFSFFWNFDGAFFVARSACFVPRYVDRYVTSFCGQAATFAKYCFYRADFPDFYDYDGFHVCIELFVYFDVVDYTDAKCFARCCTIYRKIAARTIHAISKSAEYFTEDRRAERFAYADFMVRCISATRYVIAYEAGECQLDR